MSAALAWQSRSPEQTLGFGRLLGELVQPHDLIALCGPLGAGKTHLVKGIAAGLGVPDDEPIVSPTFVLIREYVGRLRLYHLDAYRLHHAEELVALGLEEMLDDDGAAVVIEWADRVARALPPASCCVELAHLGEQARAVTVRVPDPARRGVVAGKLDEMGVAAREERNRLGPG